jgi:3-methylfumaryl-CoA hydratase
MNIMSTVASDSWKSWVGRDEVSVDSVHAGPVARLASVLDRDEGNLTMGCAVPPLSHWLFFLPSAPQRELGSDGHPARGGFLPPVTLPRRMWAGSRIEFVRPLCVGQNIVRVSTIADVQEKQGRSGPLVFVQVRHTVRDENGPLLTEEQDIVYRDIAQTGESAPGCNEMSTTSASRPTDWRRRVKPDGLLLFRFSALTFNAHRIHYDRPYAQNVEGYPGLVVHGPLQAVLLLDFFMRECSSRAVRRFSFVSRRPLFDNAPFDLCGRKASDGSVALWIENEHGQIVMEATLNVG